MYNVHLTHSLLCFEFVEFTLAYEVGFQYPHHLSRLFKKVAGCTPNEYRMQLR